MTAAPRKTEIEINKRQGLTRFSWQGLALVSTSGATSEQSSWHPADVSDIEQCVPDIGYMLKQICDTENYNETSTKMLKERVSFSQNHIRRDIFKANPNPKMKWVSDERALAGVHFS